MKTYPSQRGPTLDLLNKTYRGFDVEALRAEFKLLCDPNDWKRPIAVTGVPLERLSIVCAAIGFMTATPAQFSLQPDGNYAVVAVGYRGGPAGDH